MIDKKITPEKDEILRISFYKGENGMYANTTGMVRGIKDLISVILVLTDVLHTSEKLMAEKAGLEQTKREDNSHAGGGFGV